LQSTEIGSKPKQITSKKDPVYEGNFSPRGNYVAFPRDKDGNEMKQIYLFSVESGDTIQLTTNAYRTLGIDWHPNGKEITRTIVTKEGFALETIIVESGECFLLKEQTPLLEDVHYSYDGNWVACTSYPSLKNTQIYIINRKDPEDNIIYSIKDDSRNEYPSWSPDNKKIAFRSEATGRGRIFIQEFQGEERLMLELDKDEEASSLTDDFCFSAPVWHPQSEMVYYVVGKYSRYTLHAHPLDGKKEPAFPFPVGSIASPRVSKDGRLIIAKHSSMISPPGIYLYKIGTESVIALTLREFDVDLSLLKKPESIWYKSFDDRNIHSWYIPGVSTFLPHPGVLFAHGGPWFQINDCWGLYGIILNTLSQSGFATFAPNFRGSTGYGSEFQNLDLGDLGGGDLEDVIYGAEWMHKNPEIDGEKIAIMGPSYGGYMTLIALTKKPDVFTTGVSMVPVTDWVEAYELGDPFFQQLTKDLFEGIPEEKKELYLDRSPITHISNIKVPVMIIAGKEDSRCPIEPIEKFVEKLKKKNYPHEFVLEKKSGHLSSRLNRGESIPLFTKIVDYLKKNLA
jgi:dipeptidyl aminopeptidase/acylaminoacyl peptidase